ncbi:hypothetical protein L596_026611 [Steinernema carpocapsae]|uniref:Major facilitator superfamily (MFS) profile domain-containing protein n=1 Tax=Steinernema carpocapsae TaxID=34508 RepID=A0A4U5M1Y4_STECR|nr:hypothetical protein L596_026611 [Steinernema carpocapsae]
MPLVGFFCSSSVSWQGTYYLMSFVTTMFSIIFILSYRTVGKVKIGAKASANRQIFGSDDLISSKTQKVFSITGKSMNLAEKTIPYNAILSTPSFWGFLLVSFGDSMGYHMFLLYGPIYLTKILGFDIAETGVLASMPYLISVGTKVVGGHFLDKATCLKESVRICLFTSFSQISMTACFVALTQITPNMPFIGQSLFTLIMVFSGLTFIGLMSGNRIISQQFSHITSSAISIQGGLASLVMPVLVALLAPNYDQDEWIKVFYVIIGLMVVTNLSFVAITKVKPAEWTKPKPIDYAKL